MIPSTISLILTYQNQHSVKNCTHTISLPLVPPGPTAVVRLSSIFPEDYSLDQRSKSPATFMFLMTNISVLLSSTSYLSIHSSLQTLSQLLESAWPIQLWFFPHCSWPPFPRGQNRAPDCFFFSTLSPLGHLIHTHPAEPRLEANASKVYILTMTTKHFTSIGYYVLGTVRSMVLRLLTTPDQPPLTPFTDEDAGVQRS